MIKIIKNAHGWNVPDPLSWDIGVRIPTRATFELTKECIYDIQRST